MYLPSILAAVHAHCVQIIKKRAPHYVQFVARLRLTDQTGNNLHLCDRRYIQLHEIIERTLSISGFSNRCSLFDNAGRRAYTIAGCMCSASNSNRQLYVAILKCVVLSSSRSVSIVNKLYCSITSALRLCARVCVHNSHCCHLLCCGAT
jgi:hypothetical protein